MIVWLDRTQRYSSGVGDRTDADGTEVGSVAVNPEAGAPAAASVGAGASMGASVGVDADVLRADEYAAVLSIDDALARAQAQARDILADATAQADAMRAAAAAAAAATDAAAQARWQAAAAEGYEDGLRRARDDANALMLRESLDAHAAVASAQARLAHLVMAAVERVVCESDRDALFARVTLRLQRLIDEASFVTLTVHPDDVARARESLSLLRDTVGHQAAFEVASDAAAPAGSCRCEWDNGVFVTGLDEELASLRRLFEREMRAGPAPAQEAPESPPARYTELA